MADPFPAFADAVTKKFDEMSKGELFVVAIEIEDVFAKYLASFPEGTNPVHVKRTEYDCATCRNFVKHLGRTVAIVDGKRTTVWEIEGLAEPFATVAAAMHDLVQSLPIKSVFRTKEGGYGAVVTRTLVEGTVLEFNHFHGNVAARHKFAKPDESRAEVDTAVQVFRRGLDELKVSAFDTVLVLMVENGLYRGAEFRDQTYAFMQLLQVYVSLSPGNKELFVWANVGNPVSRFRNTAIGTLLVDLSEGVDEDKAVKSFESKVAPLNYKRPTSIITTGMVSQASIKLEELGLTSALERRYAKLSDVSVNNVLWVDNSVRPSMKEGIAGLLAADIRPAPVSTAKATEIGVVDFLTTVVPKATRMKLFLEHRHLSNFMSLTAPVHTDAGSLFKWDNNFAWSYDGDVADSVRQRVKAAGGNVDGTMRVSLAWFNHDDLDLHVREPDGTCISWRNKLDKLDVDMNAGGRMSREPVENVTWQGRLVDGRYSVTVHNYCRRETVDTGFTLETEFNGEIRQFRHNKAVANNDQVKSLVLTVKGGALVSVEVLQGLEEGSSPKEKWGVSTQTLVPVDTLMTSPNHWDGQSIGNKHWFFLLHGLRNPGDCRGVYNEFLRGGLEPHRKVFEVLAARTKVPYAENQLSGVGFSSTRSDKATVVVEAPTGTRTYAVQF